MTIEIHLVKGRRPGPVNGRLQSYLARAINLPEKRRVSHAADIFERAIDGHLKTIASLREQIPLLTRIAAAMSRTVLEGRTIFWCGNGGSAADAQHLAAELVGRFLRERRALPSMALTVNSSVVTAIGNDYGYEYVFSRQVEALAAPGDVVVGISTSGNSKNVCLALQAARKIGAFTVAFTGQAGGAMADFADETLRMPSSETPRIQEGHILCGHMLCDYIEQCVCQAADPDRR
jgi:D-sedoheptulose 7-phosphate isomerase